MTLKFLLFFLRELRESSFEVSRLGEIQLVCSSDIDYFLPYPALSERISTHITYLDTVGRPKITLTYAQLTDRHGGNIYVRPCLSLICVKAYMFAPRSPTRCRSRPT